MKKFEILSRGSFFLVEVRDSKAAQQSKVHLISSAHITHPFLPQFLPFYGDREWLAHVTEVRTAIVIDATVCDWCD